MLEWIIWNIFDNVYIYIILQPKENLAAPVSFEWYEMSFKITIPNLTNASTLHPKETIDGKGHLSSVFMITVQLAL